MQSISFDKSALSRFRFGRTSLGTESISWLNLLGSRPATQHLAPFLRSSETIPLPTIPVPPVTKATAPVM